MAIQSSKIGKKSQRRSSSHLQPGLCIAKGQKMVPFSAETNMVSKKIVKVLVNLIITSFILIIINSKHPACVRASYK